MVLLIDSLIVLLIALLIVLLIFFKAGIISIFALLPKLSLIT